MMHMPTKRAKGRFSDIENGLLTWMESQQELGIYASDCEIRKKALDLRESLGCSRMYDEKICSAAWMERFRVRIAQQ